jgi:hypothetical protein
MKKIAAAVAVCGLAFAGVGATSAAAPSSFDTQIVEVTANKSPDGALVSGVIESEKNKCESGRDFKMFAKLSSHKSAKRGDTETLDTGTSSDEGAWAGEITHKFAGTLKLKVTQKTLGNGDICKGATTALKF